MKIWARSVVAALVVGLAGNGWGQAAGKRPMTFQDLQALKRVSDPQISASGKWVMFSVMDVDLTKNTKTTHLWVVGLGAGGVTPMSQTRDMGHPGSEAERQMTAGAANETSGRFSPDGKWVSYTSDVGGSSQLWLAPWDEAKGELGSPRKPLTAISTEADGGVWSPDSKRVMFVSSVYPECSVKGGTNATTEILTGGQNDALRNLVGVSGTRVVAAWAGAESATWAEEEACDKVKDDAAAKNPVKGQVWEGLLYRHWNAYTGQKRSHVLVVDVDGNHVRDLTPASAVGDAETPTFFVGGVQNYAWAPDSKEIAYVAKLDQVPAASTNNDVYTLRLDEPGAKAVKVSTSPGSDDGPAYSPDGKWLAFRSQTRDGFEADKFRLMVFDREKKTIKDLLPKVDDWVDEFAWGPKSATVLFTRGEKGEENLSAVVLDSGYVFGLTVGDGSIIGRAPWADVKDGEVSDVHCSPDGSSCVAVRTKVSRPAELVSIYTGAVIGPPHSRIDKVLTSLNDSVLQQLQLSDLEPFWFEGAEETQVEGFLIKPPNFDPAKKYPVKFLMHGGPQTAWGDAWSYRWNWELMAASGYVVVGINRRGSTGYGQKFVDEVSGDWGGRAYEDLMKGLDYAEAHYPFMDKNRECALGASYGGFMADWVLTHTDRFKCIVTHDGMYDPVAAWGNTEEMWFNEWEFRRPEDFPKGWDGFGAEYQPLGHPTTGGSTDTGILRSAQNDNVKGGVAVDGQAAAPWRYQNLAADQDPFRKWAPMRFIERAKTPTLVIHSQRDMRLDVSQGFELFTALQRRGVPSRMLYFPDEGHWVLKPQNSQLWNEVVGDWCDRWTKTGKYAEKQ